MQVSGAAFCILENPDSPPDGTRIGKIIGLANKLRRQIVRIRRVAGSCLSRPADHAVIEADHRGDDSDEFGGQVDRAVVAPMLVLANRNAGSVWLVQLRRGPRKVALRRAIPLERDGERSVDVGGRPFDDDPPSSRIGLDHAEVVRPEKSDDGLSIFRRPAMLAHVFFGREKMPPMRRRILPMVQTVLRRCARPRPHANGESDALRVFDVLKVMRIRNPRPFASRQWTVALWNVHVASP